MSLGKLYSSLLITFPFYLIGINAGYDFSLIIFQLALMIPFVILEKSKFDKSSFMVVIFGLTVLFSFLVAGNASTASLLAIFFFLFFLLKAGKFYVPKERIYKLIVIGLVLNLSYSILQIVGHQVGIDVFLPDFIGIDRYRLSKSWEIFRPIGFFLEPAHLAIYANLALMMTKVFIVDKKNYFRIKVLASIIVFLSFSLSGIILLATFLVLENILERENPIRILKRLLVGAAGFVVVVIVGQEFFLKIIIRLGLLYDALSTGSFGGSEGVRGNALLVGVDFFRNSNIEEMFFGVGPGMVDTWVAKAFMFSGSSTLEDGKVPNALVAIFINHGLLGLVSYIFLTSSIIIKNTKSYLQLLLFFMIHFAWGFYIGYLLWIYLILLRKIKTD